MRGVGKHVDHAGGGEGEAFVVDQRVGVARDGVRTDLAVWIDTAFNGGLALPRKQAAELVGMKPLEVSASHGGRTKNPLTSAGGESGVTCASTACSGPNA